MANLRNVRGINEQIGEWAIFLKSLPSHLYDSTLLYFFGLDIIHLNPWCLGRVWRDSWPLFSLLTLLQDEGLCQSVENV